MTSPTPAALALGPATLAFAAACLSGCAPAVEDVGPSGSARGSPPPPARSAAAAPSLEPLPVRVLDLDGEAVDPFALAAADSAAARGDPGAGEGTSPAAFVFLFTRTDCPISNRYAPELARLHAAYAGRGVAFCRVYPDPGEDAGAVRRHGEAFAYPFGAARDPDHSLVAAAGVTVTPEAAVYSPGRELRYRGRIDDLYLDFGQRRAAPSKRELAAALEAVLAGAEPEAPGGAAVGCPIADLVRPVAAAPGGR